MTDTDLAVKVEDLAANIGRFGAAVALQAQNTEELTQSIAETNERSKQNTKTLHRLGILMVAKLLTLVLLAVAVFQIFHLANTLEDCINPKGVCAQRTQATTALWLSSSEYRAERQRLITEVPIAQAKDDAVRVEYTQKRLAELNDKIAATDRAIADVQAHRGAVTPSTRTTTKQ
jgi:uncharacterized coiled-coil protein SlyX